MLLRTETICICGECLQKLTRPRQGNNLWAVYNALTDWATHAPSMKKTSSPIVTLQNRRANKV